MGAGILFSRIAGLVRERVFAYYLGNTVAAGAFRAAIRIPNLLQNLFGEGVLSASFIPVYAKLMAEGRREETKSLATVTLGLLIAMTATLVGLGVTFSSQLTSVLAPGFEGQTRELTLRLVVIMFPGAGILVLSAWCLGILNSHRRFFLSYFAPVLWNVTIIAALVLGGRFALSKGGAPPAELIAWVAWSTVVGALLQLFVQLPLALQLNGGLRLGIATVKGSLRTVIRNFLPALLARGVVQLSAYLDQILASFLGAQVIAAMAYAQILYLLPISLFGMSISSAELPEMAGTLGAAVEVAGNMRGRLERGLTRIVFLVVPSVVAFTLLGDVTVATLFQNGKFGATDSTFVWYLLMGSTVGLIANSQSRLCVSALWALHDTATPARIATIRVVISAVLGFVIVFPARSALQLSPLQAAVGLTAGSALMGWLEFWFIRRVLTVRIGKVQCIKNYQIKYWTAALVAGALGFFLKMLIPDVPPVLRGMVVLGAFGVGYLALAHRMGGEITEEILSPLVRRFGKLR